MVPKSREEVRQMQSVTHGVSKKEIVYSEQIEEQKLAGMYADAFDLIEMYINREKEIVKREKMKENNAKSLNKI